MFAAFILYFTEREWALHCFQIQFNYSQHILLKFLNFGEGEERG